MYKNVLANIPGIELYPIVALIVFFGFFAALIVWFFRADKEQLNMMANSIFHDGTSITPPPQPRNRS